LSTASIWRLGEQQRTGALSKPRELEMWVTGRCEQGILEIEEI
jgi:PIN domain nuclease of toxin-antitoxin system